MDEKKTVFSNRAYDICMWVFAVVLPALSVFYVTLADIWGLPKSTEVAGTIAAVVALVDTILRVSSIQYKNNGNSDGRSE